MHRFGERFGQTVGERLEHDRAVVVEVGQELLLLHVDAETGRHREHADVIGNARVFRRNEIGERAVRPHHAIDDGPHALLTQIVPSHRHPRARFVRVDLDVVVADGVRGQQRNHAARRQPAALDQSREHRLGIREHAPRRFADDLIVENRGIGAGEIPRLEERAPVDVLGQLVQIVVLEHAPADERRFRRLVGGPIDLRLVFASRCQRDHRLGLLVGVLLADALVIGLHFVEVLRRAFIGEQARCDRYRARRVRHIDDGPFVVRRDLDGRMHARSGRAADEQRNLLDAEVLVALHFRGDIGHFLEARRDEPR